MVCNLAMWAINTLETNRADSHPIQVITVSMKRIYGTKMVFPKWKGHLLRHNFVLQVDFYGGTWAWPIITHISMPLAIFYRFHSTVCLCEVWKRSFKYKNYVTWVSFTLSFPCNINCLLKINRWTEIWTLPKYFSIKIVFIPRYLCE